MLLDRKLTPARFPSWCKVFDDNVVVLDGKLPYESQHTLAFIHRAMLLEGKLTHARFASWCNVFKDNVAMLNGKLPYKS